MESLSLFLHCDQLSVLLRTFFFLTKSVHLFGNFFAALEILIEIADKSVHLFGNFTAALEIVIEIADKSVHLFGSFTVALEIADS